MFNLSATFSVLLHWKIGNQSIGIYDETLIGFSILAGVDYLDKKYYNLSSNIGFIQKGGKSTITFVTETPDPVFEDLEIGKLNYISVNTLVDFKYPILDKVIPYLSIGPRIDYLVSYNDGFKTLNEINKLEKLNFGMLIGSGLKCNLDKWQLGLKADYCLNFNNIVEWSSSDTNLGGSISDKTWLLNLTIGYRLK